MYLRRLILLVFVMLCPLAGGDTAAARAALWKNVRHALLAPDGQEYWEHSVKEALLPMLDGYVVSSSPKDHPTRIVLRMAGGGEGPEVTLRLEGSWERSLAPGALISFEGIAKEFRATPFMVTFDAERIE